MWDIAQKRRWDIYNTRMTAIEDAREDLKKEGLEGGIEQEIHRAIHNMKDKDSPAQLIATIMGLEVSEVEELDYKRKTPV